MSMSHTIARSFTDLSRTARSMSEIIPGNTEHNFDQAVPIAANNHYAWKATRAALQCVEIYTDQPVTIFVNDVSGGSPSDTIPMVAGQAIVWTKAKDTLTAGPGLVKVPFSVDVTDLYITNAGAAVANVVIRALAIQ